MKQKSRSVQSNQVTLHENLDKVVLRHQETEWKKPVGAPTLAAFEEVLPQLEKCSGPFILDSGCGTGYSSLNLAAHFPEHTVLGVDKSIVRLEKGSQLWKKHAEVNQRVLLIQAELTDFWRLLLEHQIPIAKHYLFYPNPWPKSVHLKRRFHAHPIFPKMLEVCSHLEARSNWKTYLEELERAHLLLRPEGQRQLSAITVPEGKWVSPFEKKYAESGQVLWKLELGH